MENVLTEMRVMQSASLRRGVGSLVLTCAVASISGCDADPGARQPSITSAPAELLLEVQSALGAPVRGDGPRECRLNEEDAKLYPEDLPHILAMREENIKSFSWSSDHQWLIYLVSEEQHQAFNLSIRTSNGRCSTFELARITWRDSG